MSWLRAALQYDRGFPRNSGGVRNSKFAHGVRTTLLDCQQNTILFGRAWAYHTNKVEVLVSAYFPHLVPAQRYLQFSIKRKGHRYGSNGLARCCVHGVLVLLLNNKYKQLYSYNETVRASGMVPGEHTVGQRRLTVQLAVGSQRTAFRSGRGLFIGTHDVITT